MPAHNDDDLDLLRHYRQSRDERAFSQLVERHLQSVYGTAYRDLRNVHDAEDVCQKVFTKLAQKGRYAKIRSVSGWLFTITRQEVLDLKRSEGRRRVRETVAAEDPALARAESPAAFQKEPNPAVQAAFNLLKEADQQALFLRFHDELDLRQMGAAMGTSQRTAQKRLYRAMDKLRTLLAKRGITTSSAVVVGGFFSTQGAAAPATCLGSRVAQQALVDAAATPAPSAVALWLAQPAAWVTGTALIMTAGAVAATVLWQNRHEAMESRNVVPLAEANRVIDRRASLAGSRRADNGFSVDDLEAIYQLPREAREAALARLEEHLESEDGHAYFEDLFRRWAALDAARGAEALFRLLGRYGDSVERDTLLGDALTLPLESWHLRSPEALVDWIQGLPRGRAESLTLNAALRMLGREDPERAFHLLSQRGASGDQPYQILADALAARGSDFMCAFLYRVPGTRGSEVTSTMHPEVILRDGAPDPWTRLLGAAMPHLFAASLDSPQEVADWVADLPDSEETAAFASAFVRHWAATDPAGAAEWVRIRDTPIRNAVAGPLLSEWSQHDPNAAMDWAFQKGQLESPYRAIAVAFSHWIKGESQRQQARRWLEAHVSEPEAAPLFGLASEALGPEAALAWSAPLAHGVARQHAINQAFFDLGLGNDPKAELHLATVEPIAAREAAALAYAEAMFIGHGRSSVMRLQKQAADDGNTLLANAAHEAHVGVVAAINPELVADEILAMPASKMKDRLLSKLLERSYRRSSRHAEHALSWSRMLGDAALRQDWQQRVEQLISEARWDHAAALPARLTANFKDQSFAEFRARLDLLSRLEPLRK